MMARLAQVIDKDALDACEGARAKLALTLERDLMRTGAKLRVSVPKRMPCAYCDGGGCDRCHRSGVLRAPEEPEARILIVEVPAEQPPGATVVLRLTRPFGNDNAIAQLLIHIRPGDETDARVARLDAPTLARRTEAASPRPLLIAVLVAMAAALGWLAANGL